MGKCYLGTMEDAGMGLVERFATGWVDTGSFSGGLQNGLDAKSISKDVLGSFEDFGVGEIVNVPRELKKKFKGQDAIDAYDDVKHPFKTMIKETTKSTLKGGAKDFINAAADASGMKFETEEERRNYYLQEVLDPKKLFKNAGTGLIAGGIKGGYSKNELDAIKETRAPEAYAKNKADKAAAAKAEKQAQTVREKSAKVTSNASKSVKTKATVQQAQSKQISGASATKNNGVSFKNSDAIVRTADGRPVEVTIKSTGDRTKDIRQAEKLCKEQYGINARDYTAPKNASNRARWFALDDHNGKTSTFTMQLVNDKKTSGMKGRASQPQFSPPKLKPAN